MSHKQPHENGPNPAGILGSDAAPLDRPPEANIKPTPLILGSQRPDCGGSTGTSTIGAPVPPIEPPASGLSIQSPYHSGGRGRPNRLHMIWVFLASSDSSFTASDISFHTGLSVKTVSNLLRTMVFNGTVTVQSPLRHLGQRWPSVYTAVVL